MVPIVLFQSDHHVPNFASLNHIKLHRVIAIYEHLHEVHVGRLKEEIGEKWDSKTEYLLWITGEILHEKTQHEKNREITSFLRRKHLTSTTVNLAHELFEDFWREDAANVMIIAFNETSTDFDLLTFNPFMPIDSYKRGKVYVIEKNETLFPDKFSNLYGYPITISMFQNFPYAILTNDKAKMLSGEDVEFMQVLQSHINFTIILFSDSTIANNYITELPDGRKVGLTGDILRNK